MKRRKKKVQLVPADSLAPESIQIVASNPSSADNKKTCSRDNNSMKTSSQKEHDEYTANSCTQESNEEQFDRLRDQSMLLISNYL